MPLPAPAARLASPDPLLAGALLAAPEELAGADEDAPLEAGADDIADDDIADDDIADEAAELGAEEELLPDEAAEEEDDDEEELELELEPELLLHAASVSAAAAAVATTATRVFAFIGRVFSFEWGIRIGGADRKCEPADDLPGRVIREVENCCGATPCCAAVV